MSAHEKSFRLNSSKKRPVRDKKPSLSTHSPPESVNNLGIQTRNDERFPQRRSPIFFLHVLAKNVVASPLGSLGFIIRRSYIQQPTQLSQTPQIQNTITTIMDSSSAFNAASASSSSSSSTRQSPSSSAAIMAPAPVQTKAPSTEPFLKDFTLVAEAAKRAQAAVMVRDFADFNI
ncbi:hypothetical protein GGI42DRAFT_348578 [Trichoderma sp. SZMC 28013]